MRPLTTASAATMSVAGDVRPAGDVARNVRPATDAGAVVDQSVDERVVADENLNHASRSRPSTVPAVVSRHADIAHGPDTPQRGASTVYRLAGVFPVLIHGKPRHLRLTSSPP